VALEGLSLVAVGDDGAIMRSSDGGTNWSAVVGRATKAHLRSVIAEPRGALVAVGYGDAIVRSIDGGANWSAVTRPGTTADLQKLTVGPKGALIAVGYGSKFERSSDHKAKWTVSDAIVRSSDGGATWETVTVTNVPRDPQVRHPRFFLAQAIVEPRGAMVAVGSAIVRSTDGGGSWSVVANSGTGQQFDSVIVGRRGELVAVGALGAIVHSNDGGANWSAIANGLTRAHLHDVVVEPNGSVVAVGGGGTIVRSVDDGANWSAVADSGTEKDLRRVIIGLKGELVAVGEGGAIVHSGDGGATWSAAVNGSTTNDLQSLIVEPKGGFIAVGSGGAIVRSRDGGVNWVGASNGGTTRQLRSVMVDPKGALIAVGSHGTIIHSKDGGSTWWEVLNSGTNVDLWSATVEPNGALVAVGDNVVVRSTDGGAIWSQVPIPRPSFDYLRRVIVEPNRTLVAVGSDAIVYSRNGGANWSVAVVEGGGSHFWSVIVEPSGTLVAFGDGIVRSRDGGASWSRATGNMGKFSSVIVEPKGALVAVGSTISRSTDGGASWSKVAGGTTAFLNRAIVGPLGTLVAVGSAGAIVRSSDGGGSWSPAIDSGTTSSLNSVIADPKGALVAVGAGGTIVRSSDGGASWSSMPRATDKPLVDIVVSPNGDLVAVGDRGAVVRSYAKGTLAPTLQSAAQGYSPTGKPILRVRLKDVAQLCAMAKCITFEARSAADHRNGVAPRVLPADSVSIDSNGTVAADIEPAFVSASSPDPIYVRARVNVPGHSRMYPSGDAFFEVENHPNPVYTKTWFITLVAVVAIAGMLYATLWTRPLWLLSIAARPAALDALPKAGIPVVGNLLIGLVRALLLPLLLRHSRVLDAWLSKHELAIRNGFETAARNAVGRVAPYMALPLDGPEGEQIVPSPHTLVHYFRAQRCCMQIIGQGGAGKTRLAIEMGRWLFARQMTSHPAGAIFVDEDFDDLFGVVEDKLRALVPELPPPEFVQALLSRGRLWVIVDRISERQKTTRESLTKVYRKMSPKALICTARFAIPIDLATSTVVRPRALDSSMLLRFLADQLRVLHAADLYPGLADQGVLVQRLAQQITLDGKEIAITPLLVRIFVAQAVDLARRGRGINDLPASVPEAYFAYVEQLDATKRSLDPETNHAANLLRRAAALIAYVEVGDDFRPKAVPRSAVDSALQADSRLASSNIDYVSRLEANGLLTLKLVGTEQMLEYVLDPLAECLAAFEHARLCGNDRQRWSSLMARLAEYGESAKGFMLALRMSHAAYAPAFGFPAVEFAKAD